MSDLTDAVCAAQLNMKVAEKDANNPFFKSNYSSYAAIHAACVPMLNAQGVLVSFTLEGETVVTSFLKGQEAMSCVVPLLVDKKDMQGLGSAITYARRYGLQMLAGLAVAEGDDDGNAAAQTNQREPAKAGGIQDRLDAQARKPEAEKVANLTNQINGITTMEELTTAQNYVGGLTYSDQAKEALKSALMNAEDRLHDAAVRSENYEGNNHE